MRTIYKFIPHERLTLRTNHTVEEVEKLLFNNTSIDDASDWRWLQRGRRSDKYFGGQLFESAFKIRPNISYRNSFLPVIEGKITSEGSVSSRIQLTLQLHIFVRIFAIIWIVLTLVITTGNLSAIVSSEENLTITSILKFIFFVGIGCAVFIGGFKYESIKARKFLIQLLDAKEVDVMK